MKMRRSTLDWIDDYERAYKRRCYLQSLGRSFRELEEASRRANGASPRLSKALQRIRRDISGLVNVTQ